MKKTLSKFLAAALVASMLAGCGGNAASTTAAPDTKAPEATTAAVKPDETEAPTEAPASTGKVAIVTNTVSQNEEEYRSAEKMAEKYGDRIVHVTWPDNFMNEQEQMITTVSKLAADPDVKALVINQAVPGTNAAVDKLKETRDDILVIYGTPQENPEDVATRADLLLQPDELRMGPAMIEQAAKLGAKTFVHYSFPRHMAQVLLSSRRDLMKEKCKEMNIEFVDATAPDPTGDSGTTGAQQFILEDVPKMVAQYGADTAFFSTNCAMQVPLIKACVDAKAIYPQPCCPSPYHGYPAALGLVSEDASAAEIDVKDIVDQTTKVLEEKGVLGRFSTWPVPVSMMITVAGTEYAFQWMDGKTGDSLNLDVLKAEMEEYAGMSVTLNPYTDDAGKVYDNYQFIMMDYMIYGE
ncbi:DUF3798 domain-containing protein [Hominifimenecus sp. rT4P-3]|uniref:DUF3798 domain-containing protein n=1 Tax=Hominifimenecus sp. rT4P-3 TaxID=3242979 RepID=UPI003DA6A46E